MRQVRIQFKLLNIIAVLAWLTPAGCSDIHLGSTISRDQPPTTYQSIDGSGSFTSVNAAVSGAVTIYNMGSGSYIVFLAGLSTPSESGLLVQVVTTVGTVTSALRTFQGDQSYTFQFGSTPTFQQVNIYSTINARIYGQATIIH